MLQQAVESLRTQGMVSNQHLVVDGGSVDGTLDWVRAQPDLTLIEGPDRGVYDALNKGLAAATGDVIGYLNSDDVYEPGALRRVATAFADTPSAASVAGIAVVENAGREVERIDRRAELMLDPAVVLLGRTAPNPRFFRRDAARHVGAFDIALRYVADRDWLLRFAQAGFSTTPIEAVLYRFRQHEGSLTFDPQRRHLLPIRDDRLRLAVKWRSNREAAPAVRRAAAVLEARMRLAVAHGALGEGRFGDMATALFDPRGWLRLGVALARSRAANPSHPPGVAAESGWPDLSCERRGERVRRRDE